MKKFLALLLALLMLLTLVACGGTTSESSKAESKSSESSKKEESKSEESSEDPAAAGRFDALQEVDEQVNLLLYWHNLQPTVNEEPTEESPKVRNACRKITAEWLAAHPNVQVEWCRNLEMNEEWVTVNYTAHTGPDTLFYWGGKLWVEREMALILDDIIESPNYYEPGSPIWKDMFPEYLFDGTESTKMALNDKNQVVAVPVVMAPGSDTAYYFNKDLAETLGLSDVVATRSWKQLKENILTAKEAGYTGTVVYNHGFGMESGGSWDAQFSLNAAYLYPMVPDLDYDGDGIADYAESFKKQWETGYFYMQSNPAVEEYWEEYFWKAHYGLDEGFRDIDYTQPWADGKVLYIEEGLWSIVNYASNTELTFDVGMFPPPYQGPADSEYVCDVEWTDAGPYRPPISTAFNIMNPETQEKPDYIVDYVVDWMKYVMTNDNLSIQIEEGEGVVGATKNCQVPSMMVDWFKQSFPKKPGGYSWVTPGATEATSTERTALYEEYMFGMKNHEEWIKAYDELLYKTMTTYFQSGSNEENKAAWDEEYGWGVDIWDTDPVKPPHMA